MKNEERLELLNFAPEKLQFGCLLVLGIIELALVAFGPALSYLPYFVTENYCVIPGLVFLGTALISGQSPLAKRSLLAGIAAVAWISMAQSLQHMAGEAPDNVSMHWAAYLLVFPFAAVEKERGKGLKLVAGLGIAAAMLLTLYAGLLKLDVLPEAARGHICWDGARLNALWHPNVTACILMAGIGFSLGFCFRTEKIWARGLLLVAAVLQFAALALTNGRTNILMACALVAGVAFFGIFRGGWKRLLLGGLAAVAVFGGLFVLSDVIYEAHHDQLLAAYVEEQEPESGAAQAEEVKLPTQSGQGSLLHDMKTLNGRTGIWQRALKAVRWNPKLLLRGTSYVGDAISAIEGGPVEHAHNSWMQMLVGFGLPGLLIGLYFAFLAMRGACFLLLRAGTDMWRKCIALLVLCLMMAGFLEPFLFTGYIYYHFINILFFLCTGYVDLWREETVHPERV